MGMNIQELVVRAHADLGVAIAQPLVEERVSVHSPSINRVRWVEIFHRRNRRFIGVSDHFVRQSAGAVFRVPLVHQNSSICGLKDRIA